MLCDCTAELQLLWVVLLSGDLTCRYNFHRLVTYDRTCALWIKVKILRLGLDLILIHFSMQERKIKFLLLVQNHWLLIYFYKYHLKKCLVYSVI